MIRHASTVHRQHLRTGMFYVRLAVLKYRYRQALRVIAEVFEPVFQGLGEAWAALVESLGNMLAVSSQEQSDRRIGPRGRGASSTWRRR
jgi:hypothetical protein